MPIDVEVMIVSFGSADQIAPCLASIERLVPDVPVAVREHHPDPAMFERLTDVTSVSGLDVRIEHDATNPGFGAGCNALASGSTASWFLFLNPDTELATWPWSDLSPERSVIGPVFTEDPADHYGRSYRIRDEIAHSWLRRPGRVPDGTGFVSGAALLVDAETFRALDGFDEAYFLFYEDIDLCLRANEIGVPTRVEPTWRVSHARGHSTSERFGDALTWSYQSACRFHAAHGSPVLAYRAYVVADSLARAALHALRRDAPSRSAYMALARRALDDCVRRTPGAPGPTLRHG